MVTMISGGAKSGKSFCALTIALKRWTFPADFAAAGEIFDDKMKGRAGFVPIEEPFSIGKAVSGVKGLSSLTVCRCFFGGWVDNEMGPGNIPFDKEAHRSPFWRPRRIGNARGLFSSGIAVIILP
jgi:hypothetical protein